MWQTKAILLFSSVIILSQCMEFTFSNVNNSQNNALIVVRVTTIDKCRPSVQLLAFLEIMMDIEKSTLIKSSSYLLIFPSYMLSIFHCVKTIL